MKDRYRIKEYTLPEFAFLEDNTELRGRNVVIHVRTMTVVEMFEVGRVNIYPDRVTIGFKYTNIYGGVEDMECVLHEAPLVDDEDLIEEIMHNAILYYCRECDQMDKSNPDNLMN